MQGKNVNPPSFPGASNRVQLPGLGPHPTPWEHGYDPFDQGNLKGARIGSDPKRRTQKIRLGRKGGDKEMGWTRSKYAQAPNSISDPWMFNAPARVGSGPNNQPSNVNQKTAVRAALIKALS